MSVRNKLLSVLLFLTFSASAQYGFEWIRPGQPYYKFRITEQGVYRITPQVMTSAGISVETLDPRRIQVFRNGVEQAVFVHGEQDGSFDAGDFVELYADKNDGSLDELMYKNPVDYSHPWYSFVSDTAVYFLTVLPSGSPVTAKRLAADGADSYTGFTAEPWFLHKETFFRPEEYIEGINLFPNNEKYNSSEYTDGEGWGAAKLGLGQSAVYPVPTPFLSSTGPAPSIEIKLAGVSDYYQVPLPANHHVVMSIAPAGDPGYQAIANGNIKFKGYITQKINAGLSLSNIGTTTTNVKMEVVNDLFAEADYNSLIYIRLSYTRNYNAGGQTKLLFSSSSIQPGSKTYIAFSNYGTGAQTVPLLYDLNNNKRVRGTFNAGTAQFLADRSASQLYMFDSSDIRTVSTLSAVTFSAPDPLENYEFIIVTHPLLADAANQYEAYRSQKYKVLKVQSQQLYDYYTYGQMHPLAIRRMAAHLLNTQLHKPRYMLLLGKGYQTNLLRQAEFNRKNLVPALGVPASDVMLTAGITGTGFEADIPTGRIAAANNQQATDYLDKLVYYETTPDSILEWRKHVLHISGGDGIFQQSSFSGQINNNRATIRGPEWGAEVYTYNKSSTDPVQNNLREQLQKEINDGVSLMTFLGHAAATITDVNFGSLEETNNFRKYPLFYFNGCNVGNPSDIDPSNASDLYGRDYVCAPNKGVIGWLAHANITLDGKLYSQMNAMYNQLCITGYGLAIGDIFKASSISLAGGDEQLKSHCYQLTLQGDPAVKIYSPVLPDYKIEPKNLSLYPPNVNASMDSFALSIVVTNQARVTGDSFTVDIIRTFPSGAKTALPALKFPRVLFKDTLYIWLKSGGQSSAGNNTFEVTIDRLNQITESNKLNNTAISNPPFYIPGTGVKGLLPEDFGIVTTDSAELIVQNNNLSARNGTYEIQADTTASFSSPAFRSSGQFTADAIATWKFLPVSADTAVYFWRSRLIVPNAPVQEWDNRSFTHIRNGMKGWSQSRFEQYTDASASSFLTFDTVGKTLGFVPDGRDITVTMARWSHGGNGIKDPGGATPGAGSCLSGNGIVLKLYDRYSVKEDLSLPGYPTNCNPFVGGQYHFYTFDTRTPSGQSEFVRLVDSAKTGTHFAIVSFYDVGFPSWSPAMRNAFSRLGSVKVANAQSYYTAFAFIGQKDAAPGTADEDTVFNDRFTTQDPSDTDAVVVRRTIMGRWHTGDLYSRAIGPVIRWGKVFYEFTGTEPGGRDRITVDLIAVTRAGNDTVAFRNISGNGFDISPLDPVIYSRVKLHVNFLDSPNRTPAQFGRWTVTYDPAPEGVINMKLASEFYNTSMKQGDSIRLKYAFQNLTSTPFDSLDVNIRITDANRVIRADITEKVAPLGAKQYFIYEKKVPTYVLSGQNTLNFSVNGLQLQPETDYNNNFLNIPFNVEADKTNPLLDVTFDGYRIMNGDYVSPTPNIRITSRDDNPFLIQNDTAGFSLSVKGPGRSTYEKIAMSSPYVKFYPGTKQMNKAAIEYTPAKLGDGLYTLRVQTRDASGNISAKNAYEVEYNVLNQSTITHFFPYPNPGTTSIRFVFTLTGSKAPDQLLVRIMTISGKIVREVNRDEFGAIKIGHNVSEFAWDGTDQYGDRLANGVYLYQVLTRIDGDKIDSRSTEADKYVTHNTGKIYLMK